MKEVIIFGAGKIAEVIYNYLSEDSELRVVAFCVDAAFIDGEHFLGLPLISIEDAPRRFSSSHYKMVMALGYHNCNHLRIKKSIQVAQSGYQFVSYINSKAWVSKNTIIGEGSIILDQASVEPMARLGKNVIIWSGSTVGHHAHVDDFSWIAAGSTIGGNSRLGKGCFLGMGAIISHEVSLGDRCLVGANAFVGKDANEHSVLLAPEATTHRLDVNHFLKLSRTL